MFFKGCFRWGCCCRKDIFHQQASSMKIEVHSYQKQEHRHRGNRIHHCPQLPNHHDHLVQDHQGCLHVQPQLDPWSRLSSENSHHSILEPLHHPSSTHILFVHYYHYRHHLHDYCFCNTKGEDHQSGRPEYCHSTVGHSRSFSVVTVTGVVIFNAIAIGIDNVKTSDKNNAQAKRDSEVSQKPTSAELTG